MRKELRIFILLGVLLCLAPLYMMAQVSNTGPAGLTRQMPSIYGPYMANQARLKYRQRHRVLRHRAFRHSRRHHR